MTELRVSPRLSIITICFNNADGLRMTLDSTLRQQHGFPEYEQIVVDGGSSDSTMEVVREYQDGIAWWCSEPDKGIYNAMNKGVGHASGEYLLFLNSGDILLPDSLAKVFAHDFCEDLVYSDIYTGDGKKVWLVKSPSDDELTPAYLTINTLPHQATLIRRELHNAIGGYDESMKISAAPKFMMDALLGKHCSHRYLETAYSVFDRSGISSDIKYLSTKLREWQYFMRPYFGERVVDSFYRAKMAEKIVSKDVLEYIEKHPGRIRDVRKRFDDCVRDIKHNVRPAEKDVLLLREEVASLKRSAAYRTGMFLTWPLRKLYNLVLRRS